MRHWAFSWQSVDVDIQTRISLPDERASESTLGWIIIVSEAPTDVCMWSLLLGEDRCWNDSFPGCGGVQEWMNPRISSPPQPAVSSQAFGPTANSWAPIQKIQRMMFPWLNKVVTWGNAFRKIVKVKCWKTWYLEENTKDTWICWILNILLVLLD